MIKKFNNFEKISEVSDYIDLDNYDPNMNNEYVINVDGIEYSFEEVHSIMDTSPGDSMDGKLILIRDGRVLKLSPLYRQT